MSARAVTQSFYDQLVQAFRECPGDSVFASKRVGCTTRTARRAWTLGWTPRLAWAKAIKLVIEDDRLAARAEQRRLEEEARRATDQERDKARQDAVKALAQEGQMLAAARASVLAELASATQALPAMRSLLDRMKTDMMATDAAGVPTFNPTPKQAVQLFREFNLGLRYMVDATDRLIEAERRSKGEPSAVIGIVGADGEMSLGDAEKTIDHVTGLWELARSRGLVGAVPGVASPAVVGAPPAKPGSNGNGSVH